MSGEVKKYEYSYVHNEVDIYERDEAKEFGVVYARDIKEARALAWDKIPYDYTICSVKEVYN